MSVTFEIVGKKLQSIKSAAKLTSYSRDYITRLAREQKIVASLIDRKWFIDIDSLQHYESVVALEQKIRQQHLSEERKQERLVVEEVGRKQTVRKQMSKGHAAHAKRVTVAVLSLGLLAGLALQYVPFIPSALNRQVASAPLIEQIQKTTSKNSEASTEPVVAGQALTFSEKSTQVKQLSHSENGILLLPKASSSIAGTIDPRELFSDDVTVVTDENGHTYIVRKNDQGEEVERIPFVVVPINSEIKL